MRHWLSWIEYLATNQGVGGSNPSWRARRGVRADNPLTVSYVGGFLCRITNFIRRFEALIQRIPSLTFLPCCPKKHLYTAKNIQPTNGISKPIVGCISFWKIPTGVILTGIYQIGELYLSDR